MQSAVEPRPFRQRLRVDPHLWLELSFCVERGIPHSAFLAWSADDRAKTLAYLLESGQKCQMCGTAEWEWDPARGGNRHAYEAETHICQGCYARENVAEDRAHQAGKSVRLIPTGDAAHARRQMLQARLYAQGALE